MFRETSYDQLPWRGRSKPLWQQWNVSPSRIMILKKSYAKGMRDTALKKKTKKVPAPSDETERDRKVATPQANRSDKI